MIHLKGRVFHVNTKVQTRHGSLMCNNSLLLYLKLCFQLQKVWLVQLMSIENFYLTTLQLFLASIKWNLSFNELPLSNNINTIVAILNEYSSNCSIYSRQSKYCHRNSNKNMPYKWRMDASPKKIFNWHRKYLSLYIDLFATQVNRQFSNQTMQTMQHINQIQDSTKNEVFIEDFFSNCDQIRMKMWIWSHLLKKIT